MFYPNFAVYSGEVSKDYQGHLIEKDFLLVLSAEGWSKEEVMRVLGEGARELQESKFQKLEEFDSFISDFIRKKNLPAGTSLAAGFLKGNTFLLKTINAQIYLRRGTGFAKIIDDSKSAAGQINPGDFFVFCSEDFSRSVGQNLGEIVKVKKTQEAAENIERFENVKRGTAVFVSFEEHLIQEEKTEPVKKYFDKLPTINLPPVNLKRGLIIIGFLFISFILFNLFNKPGRVAAKKEEILAELQQAEEVAPINIETATGLIEDAERDLNDLKKLTSNKREISKVEELIGEYKRKIFKTDEKKPEEYFDLTLDDEKAIGTKIYLNNQTLFVLNPNGAIYQISLEKKSLDKIQTTKLKETKEIAVFEDNTYFLKSDGIYRAATKVEKIIEKDKAWKTIDGLESYGGNIYLLDNGAQGIFKYAPAGDKFASISAYLQPGQGLEIDDPNLITIDGAVYLANQSSILKFLNGFRAAFSFYVPEKIVISQIYTNEDEENLYVLDKQNQKIFILNKEGKYLKQIKSDILSKSVDFVVFENTAYVLSSPKIYKIAL